MVHMPPKLKSFLKFIGYTAASIAGLILILGITAAALWNHYNNEIFYKEKFDQKIWFQQSHSFKSDTYGVMTINKSGYCRGEMVEDLMSNHLKKGMTISEVKQIIGEPTCHRLYKGYFVNDDCLQYNLGGCNLDSITKILLVCFNKEGRLRKSFRSISGDSGIPAPYIQ